MPETQRKPRKRRRWLRIVLGTITGIVLLLLYARYEGIRRVKAEFRRRVEALREAGEPVSEADVRALQGEIVTGAAEKYAAAADFLRELQTATPRRVGFWEKRATYVLTNALTPGDRALLVRCAPLDRFLAEAGNLPLGTFRQHDSFDEWHWDETWMPDLANYIVIECAAHVQDQRPDLALIDAQRLLRLALFAETQWCCPDAEIERSALSVLPMLLSHPDLDDNALAEFDRLLARWNTGKAYVDGLRIGRAWSIPDARRYLQEPRPVLMGMSMSWTQGIREWIIRPRIMHDVIVYLDCVERMIELAGRPYYEVRTKWEQLDTTVPNPGPFPEKPWERPLTLHLYDIADTGASLAERLARQCLGRVAIAAYRYRLKHGDNPPSLEALVGTFLDEAPLDPFSGKPLIYRRDGNGFIVYSVGEDGDDDGGTKTSIEEMKSDLGWIISR